MLWRHRFQTKFFLNCVAKIVIEVINIVLNLGGGFLEKLALIHMVHLRPAAPLVHDWEVLLGEEEQFEHAGSPFVILNRLHPIIVVELSFFNFGNCLQSLLWQFKRSQFSLISARGMLVHEFIKFCLALLYFLLCQVLKLLKLFG